MNLYYKAMEYASEHKTEIKFGGKDVHQTQKNIEESIKKINSLGGTKKVNRIVIQNDEFYTVIYIQSIDNGDRSIHILPNDYPQLKSLVEGLSVYCQANGLLYSKI